VDLDWPPLAAAVSLFAFQAAQRHAGFYQLLGDAPYRDAVPWTNHWFWGDERFVPWHHPDSNCRMVQAAMLAGAPPPQNDCGIGRPAHRLTPPAFMNGY
jgi:6-phosphogluconolactonase/glucosamine-6-phosphate isomerase/deaminase